MINISDKLELKKPHPCSENARTFTVMRVGSDIKIKCDNCGHEITLERIKLEKQIKRIIDGSVK